MAYDLVDRAEVLRIILSMRLESGPISTMVYDLVKKMPSFTSDDHGPVKVLVPRDAYYEAFRKCGERYQLMSRGHSVNAFVEEFQKGVEDQLPLMKLSRWVGYIQGVLIADGRCTVDEERDWTRPLFRPLDFPNAQA